MDYNCPICGRVVRETVSPDPNGGPRPVRQWRCTCGLAAPVALLPETARADWERLCEVVARAGGWEV